MADGQGNQQITLADVFAQPATRQAAQSRVEASQSDAVQRIYSLPATIPPKPIDLVQPTDMPYPGWHGTGVGIGAAVLEFFKGIREGKVARAMEKEQEAQASMENYLRWVNTKLSDPDLTPEARQQILNDVQTVIARHAQREIKDLPSSGIAGFFKKIVKGLTGGDIPTREPVNWAEATGRIAQISSRELNPQAFQSYWIGQATTDLLQRRKQIEQAYGGYIPPEEWQRAVGEVINEYRLTERAPDKINAWATTAQLLGTSMDPLQRMQLETSLELLKELRGEAQEQRGQQAQTEGQGLSVSGLPLRVLLPPEPQLAPQPEAKSQTSPPAAVQQTYVPTGAGQAEPPIKVTIPPPPGVATSEQRLGGFKPTYVQPATPQAGRAEQLKPQQQALTQYDLEALEDVARILFPAPSSATVPVVDVFKGQTGTVEVPAELAQRPAAGQPALPQAPWYTAALRGHPSQPTSSRSEALRQLMTRTIISKLTGAKLTGPTTLIDPVSGDYHYGAMFDEMRGIWVDSSGRPLPPEMQRWLPASDARVVSQIIQRIDRSAAAGEGGGAEGGALRLLDVGLDDEGRRTFVLARGGTFLAYLRGGYQKVLTPEDRLQQLIEVERRQNQALDSLRARYDSQLSDLSQMYWSGELRNRLPEWIKGRGGDPEKGVKTEYGYVRTDVDLYNYLRQSLLKERNERIKELIADHRAEKLLAALLGTSLGRAKPNEAELLALVERSKRAASSPAPASSVSEDGLYYNPSFEQLQQKCQELAEQHGLDPNVFMGLIKAESNFLVAAVGYDEKGQPQGRGLGQLVPSTARELGVSDPFDWQQNLDGAARYLKQQLEAFNNNLDLALWAYNKGPSAVEAAGRDLSKMPADTKAYVQRVKQYAQNPELLVKGLPNVVLYGGWVNPSNPTQIVRPNGDIPNDAVAELNNQERAAAQAPAAAGQSPAYVPPSRSGSPLERPRIPSREEVRSKIFGLEESETEGEEEQGSQRKRAPGKRPGSFANQPPAFVPPPAAAPKPVAPAAQVGPVSAPASQATQSRPIPPSVSELHLNWPSPVGYRSRSGTVP